MSPSTVHYLPLATTAISVAFFIVLCRAIKTRKTGPHLWWWAAGVAFYGLGTALEGSITLFGNTLLLTKVWYIAGALLGGYPLAQGVVYLLLKRKTANVLSYVTVPFILATATIVALSPVDASALEPFRPSGSILVWSWVRLMTPFINLYAFAFLVGGAVLSAVRYKRTGAHRERVLGNVLIALGGTLPGIGGAMAKAGFVEVLYVGELVGLCLIWRGYAVIVNRKHATAAVDSVADRSTETVVG